MGIQLPGWGVHHSRMWQRRSPVPVLFHAVSERPILEAFDEQGTLIVDGGSLFLQVEGEMIPASHDVLGK